MLKQEYFNDFNSDILRSNFNKEIEDNDRLSIQDTMLRGELITDELANKIVLETINLNTKLYSGILLDGYPRTLPQATFLTQYISQNNLKYKVINIQLNKEITITKLLGRRICKTCGGDFNIASVVYDNYDMPAILPNSTTCKLKSACNPVLIKRDDDTKEVINKRIEDYELLHSNILHHYHQLNLLKTFHVMKGIKDSDSLIKLIQS